MKTGPLGVILAGGLARRMGGGDKGLRKIGGMTILERVIERLSPRCTRIVINANGDPSRFAFTKLPVVADNIPDFAGPLAGILAALDWSAANLPGTEYVVSAPGDSPFLPRDLVDKLEAARAAEGKAIALAKSGTQQHPVAGLWPVALRDELRRALTTDGVRKAGAWAAQKGVAFAEWPAAPFDPFFNVNTPQDAEQADEIAAQHSGA